MNIANFSVLLLFLKKKYQGKVPFSFLPFDNCISGILYLQFEEKIYLSEKILLPKRYFCPYYTMVKIPCSVISGSVKISKSLLVTISKVTMKLRNVKI